MDFWAKNIDIKDKRLNLLLYDTAGQEKYRDLIPIYIRDAQIIILTYDITNKDSFIHIDNWIDMIKDLKREDLIIVLVGNKKDLEDQRQVSTEEAEDFAKQKGFLFSEVSSKIGEELNVLFENIIFPEIEKTFFLENNKNEIIIEKEGENNINIKEKKEKPNDENDIDFYGNENNGGLNDLLNNIKAFGYLGYNKRIIKDYRILMLGLDNSGKTVILYHYKKEETVKTSPTIGFNVETLDYNNFSLTIWDVGGTEKIRILWKHYFEETDGLIFVVDTNDKERIEESANELKNLVSDENLKNCPILILANKQDLKGTMSSGEVTEKIGIDKFKDKEWFVQGCSGITGQGLKEGLDWLISKLKNK